MMAYQRVLSWLRQLTGCEPKSGLAAVAALAAIVGVLAVASSLAWFYLIAVTVPHLGRVLLSAFYASGLIQAPAVNHDRSVLHTTALVWPIVFQGCAMWWFWIVLPAADVHTWALFFAMVASHRSGYIVEKVLQHLPEWMISMLTHSSASRLLCKPTLQLTEHNLDATYRQFVPYTPVLAGRQKVSITIAIRHNSANIPAETLTKLAGAIEQLGSNCGASYQPVVLNAAVRYGCSQVNQDTGSK